MFGKGRRGAPHKVKEIRQTSDLKPQTWRAAQTKLEALKLTITRLDLTVVGGGQSRAPPLEADSALWVEADNHTMRVDLRGGAERRDAPPLKLELTITR